jgi:hypothetical protein
MISQGMLYIQYFLRDRFIENASSWTAPTMRMQYTLLQKPPTAIMNYMGFT